MDASSRVDLNKEKGTLSILDGAGKVRLVYTTPLARVPSGKAVPLPLEWDSNTSSLFVWLPDLAFPLIVAFGIATKLPEVKGGFSFGFAFPSFKFNDRGEVVSSSDGYSSEEEESEDKGKEKEKEKSADKDKGKGKFSFGFQGFQAFGGPSEKKVKPTESPKASPKV